MRVALDVGGVVCDWWGGILAAGKKMGLRDQLPLHKNWIHDWYGQGDAFFKVWDAVKSSPDWWLGLAPIPGAREAITFDVTGFITARPCKSVLTLHWLKSHGFKCEWAYTTRGDEKKVDVMVKEHIDVLVDDKPAIFEEVRSNPSKRAFLMDQPWNRLWDDRGLRIKSLAELPERLGGLLGAPPPPILEGGHA